MELLEQDDPQVLDAGALASPLLDLAAIVDAQPPPPVAELNVPDILVYVNAALYYGGQQPHAVHGIFRIVSAIDGGGGRVRTLRLAALRLTQREALQFELAATAAPEDLDEFDGQAAAAPAAAAAAPRGAGDDEDLFGAEAAALDAAAEGLSVAGSWRNLPLASSQDWLVPTQEQVLRDDDDDDVAPPNQMQDPHLTDGWDLGGEAPAAGHDGNDDGGASQATAPAPGGVVGLVIEWPGDGTVTLGVSGGPRVAAAAGDPPGEALIFTVVAPPGRAPPPRVAVLTAAPPEMRHDFRFGGLLAMQLAPDAAVKPGLIPAPFVHVGSSARARRFASLEIAMPDNRVLRGFFSLTSQARAQDVADERMNDVVISSSGKCFTALVGGVAEQTPPRLMKVTVRPERGYLNRGAVVEVQRDNAPAAPAAAGAAFAATRRVGLVELAQLRHLMQGTVWFGSKANWDATQEATVRLRRAGENYDEMLYGDLVRVTVRPLHSSDLKGTDKTVELNFPRMYVMRVAVEGASATSVEMWYGLDAAGLVDRVCTPAVPVLYDAAVWKAKTEAAQTAMGSWDVTRLDSYFAPVEAVAPEALQALADLPVPPPPPFTAAAPAAAAPPPSKRRKSTKSASGDVDYVLVARTGQWTQFFLVDGGEGQAIMPHARDHAAAGGGGKCVLWPLRMAASPSEEVVFVTQAEAQKVDLSDVTPLFSGTPPRGAEHVLPAAATKMPRVTVVGAGAAAFRKLAIGVEQRMWVDVSVMGARVWMDKHTFLRDNCMRLVGNVNVTRRTDGFDFAWGPEDDARLQQWSKPEYPSGLDPGLWSGTKVQRQSMRGSTPVNVALVHALNTAAQTALNAQQTTGVGAPQNVQWQAVDEGTASRLIPSGASRAAATSHRVITTARGGGVLQVLPGSVAQVGDGRLAWPWDFVPQKTILTAAHEGFTVIAARSPPADGRSLPPPSTYRLLAEMYRRWAATYLALVETYPDGPRELLAGAFTTVGNYGIGALRLVTRPTGGFGGPRPAEGGSGSMSGSAGEGDGGGGSMSGSESESESESAGDGDGDGGSDADGGGGSGSDEDEGGGSGAGGQGGAGGGGGGGGGGGWGGSGDGGVHDDLPAWLSGMVLG